MLGLAKSMYRRVWISGACEWKARICMGEWAANECVNESGCEWGMRVTG